MVGYFLGHSSWFQEHCWDIVLGTDRGMQHEGGPRQEYMDEITEGRRFTEIKRLALASKNCKPTNSWVEEKK